MAKKIGEKIVAAEKRIEDIRDQVATILKAAEDDNERDLLDEESDQISALQGELESTEKSLKGLKDAEKALSSRAESREVQTKGHNMILPARVKENEGKFPLMTKIAVIKTLAHVMKTSPAAVIQERYGNDARIAPVYDHFEKAATGVATTTAAGWAAELVSDDTVGFINELEAVSIYGAMAAGGMAIPFGSSNSITVPKRAGKGAVSGSFVGENATIPVKADAYGSITFNRYKAAVVTVFTEELARTSTPQVENLLRHAILSDTARHA